PSNLAFRNATTEPPPGWQGPRFELSHDYPQTLPEPCTASTCPWLDLRVDFGRNGKAPEWKRGGWEVYMATLLKYVREGQDDNLANEVGFRVKVAGTTRWFHVPWMAYDPAVGREFVHGTTNERTAALADFVG